MTVRRPGGMPQGRVPCGVFTSAPSWIAGLHASAPPETERRHGPAEEAAVVSDWLRSARTHMPRSAAAIDGHAPPVLAGLAALAPVPERPLHRDLHDKQVLVTRKGRVGIVDFDSLTQGDVAVDVANLLVHLELRRYERRRVDGCWMIDDEVTRVIERLLAWSYEDRVANACIGAERADLVLAGCAILDAIRRAFPCQRLRVADRGLREGMLVQMMREDGVWGGDGPTP